ncbi:MAG: sugar ABC transporter ATP-binding protein [Pirellulales bacterium]
MSPPRPIVDMQDISKRFAGVQALGGVSLSLAPGEVVALVGENGAGKSTLLKILGGILAPDEGTIVVDQTPRSIGDVRTAESLGIRLIHQELNLAADLSVAENLFLGRQPFRGPRWFPLTDGHAMHAQATEILRRVGLNFPTSTPVGRLSIAQQQLIEVGKALSTDAGLLVFDEPTSSLSLEEANRLLELIEELRRQGKSILYVSHRLQEVVRIADRVVVLRDGTQVGTLIGGDINESKMVSLMIGRELSQLFQRQSQEGRVGEPVLEVQGLRYPGGKDAVSFSIAAGEIIGVAGLVGAGRTELARALFGVVRADEGEVLVRGRRVAPGDPRAAMSAGMAFVPEDRKRLGLLLEKAIEFNMTLAVLPRLSRFGLYRQRAAVTLARELQSRLAVASPDLERSVASLSGGNQQKVVLAKWLATEPSVLILDEPTRGVDVGAKSEIYRLMRSLADEGLAVMMISSDMEEIVGVSDRVMVMHEGRQMGELLGDEINETAIMQLAVGGCQQVG